MKEGQFLTSKRALITFALIAMGAGVLYGAYLFSNTGHLPSAFTEARDKAALASQEIVRLTNETSEIIKEVNNLERTGAYAQARETLEKAEKSNEAAHKQAITLSVELQGLAESLVGVRKSNSQRLAYQAVAVELSLVTQFINYTDQVNSFLEELAAVLEGIISPDRTSLEAKLKSANEMAKRINDLNAEFQERMKEFDRSLEK
jgi:hypothetical protein